MDIITIDFETYYDKQYSLRKLTTEEYIRDPQFQVIGVSVKVNDGDTYWASGDHDDIAEFLHAKRHDWKNSIVVAHNTLFDGAIMSWLFGIKPKVWADTLCMGRALHGVEVGGSLKALAERYHIGQKGTEVQDALGKRREDFSEEELDRYGDYCVNDVELTYKLFRLMGRKFPKQELRLIDLTLRMYLDPVLDLDLGALEAHLKEVKDAKAKLLADVGMERKELMSNPKFATILEDLGVVPPTKISPTTGKETFAFAKTDEAFQALTEHDDTRVQALVAARLGTKSTLEESRTQRFIDIANRGILPIPIRYYAAHTGRWGGSDKINIQNLPSRGANGKKLKKSIIAPDGHMLIDADSSQIEARVLAWIAGQDDLINAFLNGEDVYKEMASAIYNKPVSEITKEERFIGKTTILGAGYGMGAVKFQAQLKTFGVEMSLDEARRVIGIYRDTNAAISGLWRECQNMLKQLHNGAGVDIGKAGGLYSDPEESGIILPSGLAMRYSDLQAEHTDRGWQYSYKVRRGYNKIYGGKVVENICQAVARCVIGHQMLLISRRYHVALTVHDSVVCCVPEDELDTAQEYIEACMRTVPKWAEGLPIDCESGTGKSYGDCE